MTDKQYDVLEYDLSAGWATSTVNASKKDYQIKFMRDGAEVPGIAYNPQLIGSDLKLTLTTDVSYYATIKVDKNFVIDGHLQKVIDGTWSADNAQNYEAGKIDISDKFIDATYKNASGKTINLAAYNALTDEQKEAYEFVDGTLKLTIQTHAAHSSEGAYNSFYFTTDTLYNLEESWATTGAYTFTEGTSAVHFLFDSSDLAAFLTEEGGTFYGANDLAAFASQGHADDANKVTGLKIYRVENGVATEVTGEYIAAASESGNESAYNSALLSETADSTIILKNFASADSVMIGDNELIDDTFWVSMAQGSKKYTGTKLNEEISSTFENETFNLGTGNDTIYFNGYYGDDKVVLNNGETVNLNFDAADIGYEIKGKDVVMTTSGTFKAYINVSAAENYEGFNIPQDGVNVNVLNADGFVSQALGGGVYQVAFTLKKVGYSNEQSIIDTYQWFSPAYTETADGKPVSVILENSDFASVEDFSWYGLAFDRDSLTVVYVVDGEEVDVTAQYLAAIDGMNDKQYAAYSEFLYGVNGERTSTVTLVNFAGNEIDANVLVNGHNIYDDPRFATLLYHSTLTDEKLANGKYTGNALDEIINANDYVSKDGVKGVTVDSKAGNDDIRGSAYNDTIKSMSGNNIINEWGGKNKITTGSGDDFVKMWANSSNTVKLGAGNNYAYVGDNVNGTNKITTGAGDDAVVLMGGNNTVKAGNGNNIVAVNWGENKITTGKGDDMFYLGGGNNNIKSGNGNDKFEIGEYGAIDPIDLSRYTDDDYYKTAHVDYNRSYNTINAGNGDNKVHVYDGGSHNKITTGKGADEFTLNAGTNYVKAGAGIDRFEVTGGYNVLDGGKGADVYDLTGYGMVYGGVKITDTKGANVLNFGRDVDVYFDVTVGKKGKAVYDSIRFVDRDDRELYIDGDDIDLNFAKDVFMNDTVSAGKKSIATVDGYNLDVSGLASEVASWLKTNNYASTADVFAKNDEADVAALLAMYTNYADTHLSPANP